MAEPATYPPSPDVLAYLAGVQGVVEANSYERHMLWDENRRLVKRQWVEGGGGYLATIGHVGDMPVCISILADTVDDQKLLFVYATSQVVDYRMVDAWLEGNLPASARHSGGRVNRTDATNFHIVFSRREAAREHVRQALASCPEVQNARKDQP